MHLDDLPGKNLIPEKTSPSKPKKLGKEELVSFFESADQNSQLEMRIAIKMKDVARVKQLIEAGGYIPVNNREARDPRFMMAITQDIKPGETQRQAAKMGFKTDRAGVPPLLHKSAAKNTSANKAYNIGLTEDVESPKITQQDLAALEAYADKLFAKVGIDVEFTRHFLDRVNDERNQKQINVAELTRLFKQEYKRWGKKIAQLGPDAEAVMKDMRTDVNLPFALVWDQRNQELDLIAKTVMRKKDFKTSNPEFAVESPLDDVKRYLSPKIKRKAYAYAAKVLHDVIQRKKSMGLKHSIEYYADQVGKSIKGINGRALADYYEEEYGLPEGFDPRAERIPPGDTGHVKNAVQSIAVGTQNTDKYGRVFYTPEPDDVPKEKDPIDQLFDDQLSEVVYNTHTKKDDPSRYDYDEFIDHAKPTGKTINGYEIYTTGFSSNNYEVSFLVKSKDDEGFLGELHLEKFSNMYQSTVTMDPELHGKGIALPLYMYVLSELNIPLVSDGEQSPGGASIWKRLTQQPGINVYIWNADTRQFMGKYDPAKPAEVYGDDEDTHYHIRLVATTKEINEDIEENFADGKVKGKSRPGRVKKAGASCKGSVTDLRAKAKKYSGERGKMYHWCANMKSGKQKK